MSEDPMIETVEQRRDRVYAEALAAERTATERFLWWLSFVDPELPQGSRFLGACIVEAATPVGAVLAAHAHGCNPGGEILTAGPFPLDAYAPAWRNRLLSRDETLALNGIRLGDANPGG